MADIVITIAAALAFGFLAHEVRIPPLVGFLTAGFCLHLVGFTAFDGLQEVSDLGVVLLLFTIGLKFDLRSLLQPEAHGTAALHMITVVALGAGTIGLAAAIGIVSVTGGLGTLALLGFALSFSSTVLVVKVLEDRSDDGSYYGQIAIAILVLQDLAAVAFITIAGEEPPSPRALALVLLIPGVWLLSRVLDRVGRGELLVLFGVVMALGPGYVAFEAVGIHGDLGALVLGLAFSTHPRAVEMSKSLFSVKELFLVGFFVVIGLQAVPTWSDLLMALTLCAILLPFNFVSFYLMGRLFGLRNRTSVRSSLALSNFSEFALIVVAVGIDNDLNVIGSLRRDGFTVLEGDATDHEFWHRLVVGGTAHTVVLAMALHDSNTFALEQLRIAGFPGTIAAVVQRPDQADHFARVGVHAVINIYSGSGAAVADAAIESHDR